jgi:hypothetical protein
MKMLFFQQVVALLVAGMMATGGIASIGLQTFAQSNPASNTPVVTTPQAQDIADNGKDGQDENVVLPTGGISEAQARTAITAQYPNVAIQHIELEDNNGTIVYGAKLADKTEVIVDAKTGVVTKEVADQEGIEHQDFGKSDTEANGVETNDGPDTQNETGETGQN